MKKGTVKKKIFTMQIFDKGLVSSRYKVFTTGANGQKEAKPAT